MSYRVLVVEDHKIMRDGIRVLLDRSGEFTVAGEAESGAEAIQVCAETNPDMVLMDIGLPGLSGVDTTVELLRHCPNVKVIILSMYDDEDSVVSSIRAGAQGYVVKRASSGDLLDALRAVAKGSSYLSPNVSERLLSRIRRGDAENAGRHPLLAQLTPREYQVLGMIVEGKASKEIAVVLNLGVETVRSYRKTMMKKLNVSNVAGLIRVAMAAGLTARMQHRANGAK
jgi:DNA-binding NarL/FixJ family response regulator